VTARTTRWLVRFGGKEIEHEAALGIQLGILRLGNQTGELYLVLKNRIWSAAAVATLVVTIACYLLAQPVPGIVSGSLGTLIGADLLNLGRIQGLGAPVVSIGDAGTFDGVFLTEIIAVLLASFSGRA
jgi:uncharacterized membrane protein